METMVLMGAEDVRRAAGEMQSAAERMISAASQIDWAFQRHQQFMDEWLSRLEAVLAAGAPVPTAKEPA